MGKKKFFWGDSSSSMQTEGAWNEGGKGPSVYDVREATEHTSDWKHGIDRYHRYEEDLDLLQEMGMNFYRFQTSWSRINPMGDGAFNEEGLQFYDRYIDAMMARNIEPMLCLYHFDMPLNLAENYEGFMSKHVVDAFVEYGKMVVDRYKDKVKYWVTFNEQNLYSTPLALLYGGTLKTADTAENIHQIAHNIMVAHAKIANYIHTTTDGKIGGMLAYSDMYPETNDPKDIQVAREWDEFINQNLLNAFCGRGYSKQVRRFQEKWLNLDITEEELLEIEKVASDYLAFSYYCTGSISHKNIPSDIAPNYYLTFGEVDNPFVSKNQWGLGIDPLGFRDIINKMYQKYNIPIFPVENGIGTKEEWDGKNQIEDDYRIFYHKQHIKAMKDAMTIDGCEVLGYLGWGLIDLPSSKGDMEKRYGMVYVNRGNHELRDMKRVPKKSFYWFKDFLEKENSKINS
ncbi:glycoside hydrolase family 1 protein [Enterococcus avium]|uniref:glycoside hydrolase family 1 protein n=1 Tax=Enterococcus avium TaxID=33945 RepID=UPI001A9570A5|nr:glycoside hydrolase family 1 protein [Enterococcus avium]MBO1140775.1 glycoside hydrolase family 1 protein [Enterococcus avium]